MIAARPTTRPKWPIFHGLKDARDFVSTLSDQELREWDETCVAMIYNERVRDIWATRIYEGNRLRWRPSGQDVIRNAWSSRQLIHEEQERRR